MKVIKKFEHVDRKPGGAQTTYDWGTILSGQNVILDAGTDYEATGVREKDSKDGKTKKGESFDRTPAVIATIQAQADKQDKTVKITPIGADGKAVSNGQAVTGLVVTATPMTEEQIKARDERREKLRAAHAAAQAKNGTAAQPAAPPVEAVEPESL